MLTSRYGVLFSLLSLTLIESRVMKYCNIETRRINGHKIAYSADGRSWRIFGRTGNYTARANLTVQGKLNLLCGMQNLLELSDELEKIK